MPAAFSNSARFAHRLRLAVFAAVFATVYTFTAAPTHAGPVISWVAPYRVEESKAMLQRDFGGVGMKDGLTWLALQFWVTSGPNLTQDGSVAGAGFDNTVKWFHDWGHANGIKITLCVTDFVGDWNWPEARRSFLDNRADFVKALLAEVDRLDLDGVELDLEGVGDPTAADMAGYDAFAADLAAGLHPKGKTLTAASYPAQWNAPNWKMWPDLMKAADGVTSMGYEQTGKASNNGFNYADQKKHATPPERLMIGMPGYHGTWEGNTALEQLDWVYQDGVVGVGIWDASLADAAWQTAAVWNKLKQIKAQKFTGVAATPVQAAPIAAAEPEEADTNGRMVDGPRHTPAFGRRGTALRQPGASRPR